MVFVGHYLFFNFGLLGLSNLLLLVQLLMVGSVVVLVKRVTVVVVVNLVFLIVVDFANNGDGHSRSATASQTPLGVPQPPSGGGQQGPSSGSPGWRRLAGVARGRDGLPSPRSGVSGWEP